jgi:hypothetical protein
MLLTLQNTGGTVGLTVLFTEVIGALTGTLPGALSAAMASAGVPQIAPYLSGIPPTLALFAAFLGYNPMVTMISQLPASVSAQLSPGALATITSTTWFPRTIAPPFMDAIHLAFYFNAGLAVVAAVASMMRGKKWQYDYPNSRTAIKAPLTIQSPRRVGYVGRQIHHVTKPPPRTESSQDSNHPPSYVKEPPQAKGRKTD